jgi:hypothetical protein
VRQLKTGKLYKFRVFASNFNGLSNPSEEIDVYACGLPRKLNPPTYVASNKTTITIAWRPPE